MSYENKHEVIKCFRCNKPIYPIELNNKNRDTWCNCDKIGIKDGWWVGQVFYQKPKKRKWK